MNTYEHLFISLENVISMLQYFTCTKNTQSLTWLYFILHLSTDTLYNAKTGRSTLKLDALSSHTKTFSRSHAIYLSYILI